MVLRKDLETQSAEVGKEAYLSRLSPADQTNLRRVNQQFLITLNKLGHEGALAIVGSTINNPLPRKDIDILIVLQPHPTDIQKGSSTELEFAQKDFKIFHHIVRMIVESNPLLQIHEVFEPAIDEEFGNPGILKTDGSIVVTSKKTGVTPIEFVRIRERGNYQEILSQDKRPFIILAHT